METKYTSNTVLRVHLNRQHSSLQAQKNHDEDPQISVRMNFSRCHGFISHIFILAFFFKIIIYLLLVTAVQGEKALCRTLLKCFFTN